MEIAPGIFVLSGAIGNRPLHLYLLKGRDRIVLLDTGTSQHPEALIRPSIRSIDLDLPDVDMVINTHSDLDHCGGNHRIKSLHPGILLTCGEQDRALIEEPAVMWQKRYNGYGREHDIAYPASTRAQMLHDMGEAQQVDFTWSGGEALRLDDEWVVEIHSVPGHSPGHLALFDPRSGTMLCGDAIHGKEYRSLDGAPELCPTYLEVNAYLATIARLESLPIVTLATCHWPLYRGAEVREFCRESRDFVHRVNEGLLDELRQSCRPLTLRDLIGTLGPMLGGWPRAADMELVYVLAGHVKKLASEGLIREHAATTPVTYTLA